MSYRAMLARGIGFREQMMMLLRLAWIDEWESACEHAAYRRRGCRGCGRNRRNGVVQGSVRQNDGLRRERLAIQAADVGGKCRYRLR